MNAPAAVGGNRLNWTDLPTSVRDAIEAEAGASVVSATSQPCGFSPGLASRLLLADGRRLFAKAVSAARNPDSPGGLRREARVLAGLPASVPAARLRWYGEVDDWTALLIDDIDGRMPAQPWVPHELESALTMLSRVSEQLTPNPLPFAEHLVDAYVDEFAGWRSLAAGSVTRSAEFAWAWANLDRLAELESGWPAAVAAGTTLMHGDARADNMLVAAGGLVLVDWPHAVVGPAWMDLLFMLPSAMMQGVDDPEAVWRRFGPAEKADPDAVTCALTAIAGLFVSRSLQPAPPNLPRLRAFQAAQGRTALSWLQERLA